MPQGGQLGKNNTRQRSWTARLQLDWNKYFNDEIHNFSGGIGFEASQNTEATTALTAATSPTAA